MTPPATMAEEKPKRRRSCRVVKRPLCPEHGDTMSAGSSQGRRTYYYCGVDGCKHSAKAIYNDVK